MPQAVPSSIEAIEYAVRLLSAVLETAEEQPFPWRKERDPFAILLAEMMLVRTRADLVMSPFVEMTKRYPTASELAEVQEEDLFEILAPLGLHKRISFFVKAAQFIEQHYPDDFPDTLTELLRVPGVGQYTAEAVLAFAFDVQIVPADVNVLRWMSRVTGLPMTHPSKGSRELKDLLPVLSPLGGRTAYKLLDYLRETCRARKPRCIECPIRSSCTFGREQPVS